MHGDNLTTGIGDADICGGHDLRDTLIFKARDLYAFRVLSVVYTKGYEM